MSEEKQVLDTQSIETEDSVKVKKGKYVFLEIVAFILTVLIAQFGTNLVDYYVFEGLGAGFRILIIFAGFLVFYPARKAANSDVAMTFKEAREMMKDEYARYQRSFRERKTMTKEEKKDSRRIVWSVVKFMIAVIFVGGLLEIVIGVALINLMYS